MLQKFEPKFEPSQSYLCTPPRSSWFFGHHLLGCCRCFFGALESSGAMIASVGCQRGGFPTAPSKKHPESFNSFNVFVATEEVQRAQTYTKSLAKPPAHHASPFQCLLLQCLTIVFLTAWNQQKVDCSCHYLHGWPSSTGFEL